MIDSTASYKVLKQEMQEVFDFVVFSCNAAPILKEHLELFKNGTISVLPKPVHYGSTADTNRLLAIEPRFVGYAAKHLLLSAFALFEFYIQNVTDELITFHGGEAPLKMRASKKFDHTSFDQVAIRKLNEYPNKGKNQKYLKFQSQLKHSGFHFPSDLFARAGLEHFLMKKKKLRAWEIPGFLSTCLGYEMDATSLSTYGKIRTERNAIAHGKYSAGGLGIKDTIEFTQFLRDQSIAIDAHILSRFFLVEE